MHASEAESGLERLYQCAEKELQVYLNAEGPSKDFNEFRTKLAGLTRFLIWIIGLDQELIQDYLEFESIRTIFLT